MNKSKGIYFALSAAFISGISIFINKFAVDAISDPLVFTTIKNTGVAIVLVTFLMISGKWKKIKLLKSKELMLLGVIGVIGGSIPFYLFFKGLSIIPAVNGAVIHKTLVLWVAILAMKFLGEKLSKAGWLAITVLFTANILVGGFEGLTFSLGEIYILAATIFWAIETIVAKKILPSVDPDLLIQARMGIGAIVLLVISLILKPQALIGILSLSSIGWFWIVLTTVLLLFYVAVWYRGLRLVPAITATAILVASTLVTNALSAIFITHNLNWLLIFQSALIILGVYVLYKIENNVAKSSSNINLTSY